MRRTPHIGRVWPALLPHAVWVNDGGPIAAMEEPVQVQSRTWLLDRAATYLESGLALYSEARSRFAPASPQR